MSTAFQTVFKPLKPHPPPLQLTTLNSCVSWSTEEKKNRKRKSFANVKCVLWNSRRSWMDCSCTQHNSQLSCMHANGPF